MLAPSLSGTREVWGQHGLHSEFQSHLKKTKEGVRAETILGKSSRARKMGGDPHEKTSAAGKRAGDAEGEVGCL